MSEAFSDFTDRVGITKVLRHTVSTGLAVWGWVHERAWPVYTTGMLLSALSMLAVSQEKQILADHLYGADNAHSAEAETRMSDARRLFHEESSQGVKQVVWALPRADFRREYAERHGSI